MYGSLLAAISGNQGGLDIRTASNYIVLSDGDGNPRGIFDGSGNLGIGKVPSTSLGTGNGVVLAQTGYIQIERSTAALCGAMNSSGSNAGDMLTFSYAAAQKGSISISSVAVVYNTTSDYRLKNNQTPLTGSGTFIDALQPKTWNWAQDGTKGVGFIAHEFAEVSPSSVSGKKDAVDEKGKPVYQAMQASSAEVIANLVAEIQSLRKRLAALEAA